MIKIATNIPNQLDATSYYRAVGPLMELRKDPEFRNIVYQDIQKFNWASLGGCDLLFMQRPYTSADVGIMRMALDINLPVLVDYDDYLLDLPTDNPAHATYNDPDSQQRIAFLLAKASVVTVSTLALKRAFEKFNKNVLVIPNAINLRYFKYRNQPPARKKRVVWRGSKTHQRDVFTYFQTIMAAHQMHPQFEWHFVGSDALWFLTDNMAHKRTVIHPAAEVFEYMRRIYELAPTLFFAPLHDHFFNHCKSNIAWLEGCFAGAPTIAPDWEEWDRPGVLKYLSEPDMAQMFEMVLGGSADAEKHAREGWEYVMDNLQLQKVNKLRGEMIHSLCES